MQIYLVENGKPVGPFELEEVRQRLLDGELAPTDLGWHEDIPDWVPLSEIQGLHTPPPPPPSARIPSPPKATRPIVPSQTEPVDEPRKGLPWWALALVILIMFILILVVGFVTYWKMNRTTGVVEPGSSSSEMALSSSDLGISSSSSDASVGVSSAEAQVLNSTLNGRISLALRTAPAWMKSLADSNLLEEGQKEKLPSRRYHFVDLDGDGVNEAIVLITGLSIEDPKTYSQIMGVYSASGGQYHFVDKMNIGGALSNLVKTDTLYPQQNKIVLRALEYGSEDSTD